MKRTREAGFTLVELMLVVVILGILAAVVLPNLAGQQEKGKRAAAKTQISTFELSLDQFELDCGRYPTTEEGLNALVSDPGISGWNGPYLKRREVPRDPWQEDYVYKIDGGRGVNYDVFSKGADKQENTDDDIGNWHSAD